MGNVGQAGRRWRRYGIRFAGLLCADKTQVNDQDQEGTEAKSTSQQDYAKLAPIAFHGFSILPARREGRADRFMITPGERKAIGQRA